LTPNKTKQKPRHTHTCMMHLLHKLT
jgi:hypothetical protein